MRRIGVGWTFVSALMIDAAHGRGPLPVSTTGIASGATEGLQSSTISYNGSLSRLCGRGYFVALPTVGLGLPLSSVGRLYCSERTVTSCAATSVSGCLQRSA